MCGICGYISREPIGREILKDMTNSIIYRGPDDIGIWEGYMTKGYYIGFGHRRLSILDLSQAGHQPMLSEDSTIVIAFNGEIYNFRELKKELGALGYQFRTNCDTEVIISAYHAWGSGCFARLNGMFAIALYDSKSDKVILARDRIGKKPLYFYTKGDTLIFGSELKPIMLCPLFQKKIRYDVLNEFFTNKYICSPNTIFEDTYKIEPGSYISYENGKIEKTKYWDPIEIYNGVEITISNLSQAKRELNDLLIDSVSKRLIADVKVGSFLSSGIDSSLVTAIANSVLGKSIDTFTIGFRDAEKNEAVGAEKIAAFLGTNHHEQYISEDDVLELVSDMEKYYDEPFADSSMLPTMLVAKLAKQNVTVALSGDAGDEIFCGYKNYDYLKYVQMLDWTGEIAYHLPGKSKWIDLLPSVGKAFIENRDKRYKSQLNADLYAAEIASLLKSEEIIKNRLIQEEKIKTNNFQMRRMLLDTVSYLPDEILTKVDRASMKYSLETRCPLTDYRIVEWSYQVNHRLKYHNGEKKYLLKKLAYEYIPKELLNNPKKGFGVPLTKWLRNELKTEINNYVNRDFLNHQGIFDYEYLVKLIQKQEKTDNIVLTNLLWEFYVFQKWYDKYIKI